MISSFLEEKSKMKIKNTSESKIKDSIQSESEIGSESESEANLNEGASNELNLNSKAESNGKLDPFFKTMGAGFPIPNQRSWTGEANRGKFIY